MSSRQDQLHSYQYSLQRVVAALVTHDPDPSRSPFRRVGSTALVSVLVALIALGGTAAYAAVTNRGASDANQAGTLYIEKETGARFVFYQPDGRLHPVLNYTSGLLIIGSAGAAMQRVPRRTLARTPRGEMLGIPGAPDALPGRKDLTAQPWAVCSQSAAGTAQSLLAVGTPIRGGSPVTDAALIVTDPRDRTFLVYGNRKFEIPDVRSVQAAFFWPVRQPTAVAGAWVNALPSGPDLTPMRIADAGEPADVPGVAGVRVGDLIRARDGSNGPSLWQVALGDGTARISDTQATLLKRAAGAGRTHDVPIAQFGRLKQSADGQAMVDRARAGQPQTVPALLEVGQRLCLTVNPKDGAMKVLVDPEAPEAGSPVAGDGGVDRVLVRAGTGALVEAVASPTAPPGSGTISIVTDDGRRYPLARPEVLASLGLAGVAPQRLPAELVALLPQGPSLDPEKAKVPVPNG